MKKFLLFAAAVAMLASCSQDLTADLENAVNDTQSVGSWNGEGFVVEASAEDFTRVNTNVSDGVSFLTWEAGDELTLVHNGAAYVYLAQSAGRSSLFAPKDDANAITAIDPTQPVAAFYNVATVDPATMKATFNIAAEQVEGELTNKLPLYGYAATTVVENNKIQVVMSPLASVVEFELSASSAWNADAFSLSRSSRQLYTYASAAGLVVDAATGAIDLSAATVGSSVMVKLPALHNFATKRNISVIVPGVSNTVTSEVVEGEGDAAVTTTVTTHYAPVYHGKACVRLYKNGVENFRRTIWSAYTADGTQAVDERKHVAQPLKDILDGHKNGISTAAEFKAFADEINLSTETFPTGSTFCNEDGVVVLNNSISLADYANWIAIGHNESGNYDGVEIQFAGQFDGNNNTISDLKIDYNYAAHLLPYTKYDGTEGLVTCNSAGLFGVVADNASVKNLTVEGALTLDYVRPAEVADYWIYVGGIVGQCYGGQLENLTSKVTISSGSQHINKTRVGGVVGRVVADADVYIEDLTNEKDIEVSNNHGTTAYELIVGGVIGLIGDGGAYDLEIAGLVNNGNVTVNATSGAVVGGIFGYTTRTKEKDGVFEDCENNGDITVTAQAVPSVGGIVGQARHYEFLECVNNGNVSLVDGCKEGIEAYIGGIVGYTNGRNTSANGSVYITECENNGAVTVNESVLAFTGGIIGYATQPLTVEACVNKGDVAVNNVSCAFHVGGIVGKNGVGSNTTVEGVRVYDSINEGTVSGYSEAPEGTGWLYVGGCFGSCYGGTAGEKAFGSPGCVVDGCINKGTARALGGAKYRAGGITGITNNSDVLNCINEGTLTSEREAYYKEEFFGGIVGYAEGDTYCTINGCTNSGTLAYLVPTQSGSGKKTASENWHACLGGIIGRTKKVTDAQIVNCTFSGKVLGTNDNTHTWNDSTGAWVVPTENRNFECRAAIVGACPAKTVITSCKIGGAIGSIKNFNAETGAFEIDHLNSLVDDATSLWHWAKWYTGWTAIPTATDCSFLATAAN